MSQKVKRMRYCVASATVVLVLLQANPATGGEWTEPSTWGGGPTISVTQNSSGNLVKLWQNMLDARFNGWYYEGGPSPAVDGHFGTVTKNYTILWQTQWGLPADGVVGPQTWNRARLFNLGRPTAESSANWDVYQYTDQQGTVDVRFAKPYQTWLKQWCGKNYHITTPQIDHGWWGAPCD